jgi:hypothetical protein
LKKSPIPPINGIIAIIPGKADPPVAEYLIVNIA